MAQPRWFPIKYSSMLVLSGMRSTRIDTIYFRVFNPDSSVVLCFMVVADLLGTRILRRLREIVELVFTVALQGYLLKYGGLVLPSIRVGSSSGREQIWRPAQNRKVCGYHEISYDMELDE